MSSARQYDYGKPEDTVSEWTSKVKNLQGLVDQDDAEERARLEREIEQTKLERARRRGKSIDFTTPQSAANVSSVLSAASPSVATDKPTPMSLAAFIGGKATGPRLTRTLRPDDPVDGIDFDPKPYSNRVSPLAQVARGRGGTVQQPSSRGVAMPGMRPEAEGKGTATRDTSMAAPQRNTPKPSSHSASSAVSPPLNPAAPSQAPQASPNSFMTVAERSRQLSDARAASVPSLSSSLGAAPSVSPTMKPSIPLNKPSTPPVSASSRFNAALPLDSSAKALTPSLTRLQGRGLVGERVKAAETPIKEEKLDPIPQASLPPVIPQGRKASDSANSLEPTSPLPVRRKSILDRWPPGSSPSSEQFPVSSATLEINTSVSPPSASLTNAKSFERTRATTLEPPRTLSSQTSSLPSPSRLSPVRGSFADRGSAYPAKVSSKTSELATTKTTSVSSSGWSPTPTMTKAPTLSETPQPSISRYTSSLSSPATSVKTTTPDNSTPLNHPTRDRARKPKKGASSGAPALPKSQEQAETTPPPTTSKLSEPPQFRTLIPAEQDTTTPTVASRTAALPSSNSVSPSRSQILSPPPTAPLLRQASAVSSVKSDSVARLMDTWGNQAPIGVKTTAPASRSSPTAEATSKSTTSFPSSATRRALPGMAKSASAPEPTESFKPALTSTEGSNSAKPTPLGRSSPSLAPRPTAMDLAQALNLVDAPSSPVPRAEPPKSVVPINSTSEPPMQSSRPASKRRSSYSPVASTLPSVIEVDTPPTSLTRAVGQSLAASEQARTLQFQSSSAVSERKFQHADKPLPKVDVASLLSKAASPPPLSFNPSFKPISTDVMSIRGRSASPVMTQPHVFYDTELRAIVYRSKDMSSGLASTTIWTWRGKNAKVGDDEQWKIRDLESRFGTKVIPCEQGLEPLELISLLGGVVAIRQGSPSHWSAENTAMHCVRSAAHGSNVVINEVDLHIRNLCSAYSYVVSVLGNIYVWHGRGSRSNEASHASSYASSLSNDTVPILEFKEGEEDPMFWAYLGDEPWANADYWSERSEHEGRPSSSVWKIDASTSSPCEQVALNENSISQSAVYVVDGLFETFVIVGASARGERNNVRLAVDVAKGISTHLAQSRPFTPPVHVVILPSLLPLDLRVGHLNIVDEAAFNGGNLPDHMNVLEIEEALEQLERTSWTSKELEDPTFLPLGVSPSML